MRKRILIVDDEVQILKSLTRLFFDTDYELLCAENGEDALTILASKKVDLIISDMRMPVMDGYQLLQRVKNQYPEIIRMVFSGYADEKLIFQALQKKIAKVYVFKPWNNSELLLLINRLFETEALLSEDRILKLINDIEIIPTIKANHGRLFAMIENDAGMAEIASAIEQDCSFSAQVLHIANTAFYGIKVESIKQVVTILGIQNTWSLVLSASIMDCITATGSGRFVSELMCHHSFMTNKLLSWIYIKYLNDSLSNLTNSAGLLHNVGTVLLVKSYASRYMQTIFGAEEKENGLRELESKEFGVTHNEAGGYLLNWWEVPFPIVEAALYHHIPFDERVINRKLVSAVHVAQHYAWSILGQTSICEYYPETFALLKIDKLEFETELRQLEQL